MTANPIRNRRFVCRLLCSLLLAVFAAAGWNSAGAVEEIAVRSLNASGNRNIKPSIDPINEQGAYTAVLYDNRNGLPTSEANAIAQTEPGFFWIGSYAGLIRYDGNEFERIDSAATGIANVRCLYTDRQNHLWIGTNDTGLFMMTGRGELRKWGKAEGLKSTSIRAVAEDANGVIHIAGTAGIAMIDPEMNLTVLEDDRIGEQMIRDIRMGNDGFIYGLTQNGDLFSMKDGEVRFFLAAGDCPTRGILSILPDPERPGWLYAGTEESLLYYGCLEDRFANMTIRDISPLSYLERFEYFQGKIWICAGNGTGRLEDDGLHLLNNVPMNSSVVHVMTDYEGNLWFTSTRQGVMKIVPNRFEDLFEKYGLAEQVVNTTCLCEDRLYIGTDTGMIVLENGKEVDAIPLSRAVTASGKDLETTDLLEYLDGARIRSIIRDSQGQLWISTWRKQGLIRYNGDEAVAFTPEDGLFSDQIRTILERSDGTIVAANYGGASVIEGNRVTAGYSEKDGIAMAEILTMAEGKDDDLILGSDGGGIYIAGREGTRHIGIEEGLNSEVILRIRRSADRDIWWIVTSNSLAYMTPDYQVKTISRFPYSNNYDLYENSRGDIWVLASDGVYVVPAESLLEDAPLDPVYFSIYSGLPYIASPNSYSGLTEDGNLYIAGVKGTILVNIEKPFENVSEMKVAVPFIDIDGNRAYPDRDGGFTVPRLTRKITIYPFVFNYSLIDPVILHRLEGFDTTDSQVSRSDLVPVSYTNLREGSYHFVMRVEDPMGNDSRTFSFRITKEKNLSDGAIGTVILNIASLFFMSTILIYTSLYRKRGLLEDKLFFFLIIVNTVLAVTETVSYLQENNSFVLMKELMYAENTVFYAGVAFFPYLFLVFADYRAYGDRERLAKVRLLYGIPWLVYFIILIVNLRTGWIFSITDENTYVSGPIDQVVFVPVLFFFIAAMPRVYRINPRLVFLSVMLILARIGMDFWTVSISSTTFINTLFLVATHIHMMNRSMTSEEAPRA